MALVVVNHTTEGIERVTNNALRRINEWITTNGLRLAHEKSEAIMLTRKWAYRQPAIFYGGLPVEVKRAARYLGVLIDSWRTFVPHLRRVSEVAVKAAKAVGRLMPNEGGPSWAKRRLLTTVVTNRLLYAAPICVVPHALRFDASCAALLKAQRLAAIRIARCYRTVSMAAAFVLAETPPGDLLARERTVVRASWAANPGNRHDSDVVVTEAKRVTLDEWQLRW